MRASKSKKNKKEAEPKVPCDAEGKPLEGEALEAYEAELRAEAGMCVLYIFLYHSLSFSFSLAYIPPPLTTLPIPPPTSSHGS